MKKLLFTALVCVALTSIAAHPWKPNHYVIVDTDCGFDDLRALSLLLASSEISVLAITTSNGVLDARSGYLKVKALLNEMHHEGLLVGASRDTLVRASGCVPAMELAWGSTVPDSFTIPTAVEVVDYVLSQTTEPVIFLSLGSLNTAARCQRRSSLFGEKVSRILWSSPFPLSGEGFNYALDTAAFWGLNRQDVPIYFIGAETMEIRYDQIMTASLAAIGGPDALRIAASTRHPDTEFSRSLSDELTVLYLHDSDLFTCKTLSSSQIKCLLHQSVTGADLMMAYETILAGSTFSQNQVLAVFPLDSGSYFSDVNAGMAEAIERFGKEEWMAQTIAAELHRHLGVYAVLGVKMGLRAREYFAAGIDEMHVLSYAGTHPPFSCLNDGIQVSTGATLGHGLISINQDTQVVPCADFTYMGQTVRVSLKEVYRKQVQQEISEYNRIYGLNSNIYWELVRIAAIKYWKNWDRHEIFDIVPVSH